MRQQLNWLLQILREQCQSTFRNMLLLSTNIKYMIINKVICQFTIFLSV